MMTPEELKDLITKTKTELEARLQDERVSGSAEGSVSDSTKEIDAVVGADGTLAASNSAFPVILKENAILSGMNNQQYLTYAKKQVTDFFDSESWKYREIVPILAIDQTLCDGAISLL